MTTNYVSTGKTVPYANSSGSTIAGGTLVPVGRMVGVAVADIADGTTGDVAIEGVWNVAKVSGADITIYESTTLDVSQTPDAMEDAAATPATGDISNGAIAMETAGVGVTTVKVKLLPGQGSVT